MIFRMAECAVISGASSGIGRAVAERLIADGWDVAVLGRRSERLRQVEELAPGRVLAVTADVSDETDVRAAVQAIGAWKSEVHALITSAGDFLVSTIERTSTADFERIWRVTVLSKFLLTRELLPLIAGARGAPRAIVHVASLAAHQDFADESAYASSMHGVVGLAHSQDAELRDRGVRVAVLSPGLVRTALTQRSGFSEDDLSRALSPEAIAESALYLIATIRAGGYIPEIFHVPGNIRY